MKLGSRITDPASGERGMVISNFENYFTLRMSDGRRVNVKHAALNAARKQPWRKKKLPRPLIQDGPNATVARMAKLVGLSYAVTAKEMGVA